jgi:hypothetical protein
MGTQDEHMRNAMPWHRVYVDGLWMDKTEVRHPPQSGWLDERQTVPGGNVSGGRNRRDLTRLAE